MFKRENGFMEKMAIELSVEEKWEIGKQMKMAQVFESDNGAEHVGRGKAGGVERTKS